MEPLVSVRNLRVSFRLDKHTTFEAVKGISFDIPANSTMALLVTAFSLFTDALRDALDPKLKGRTGH